MSNDVLDNKKWLIQRIDASFQLQIDWISQDKRKFQDNKQKEIDRSDQFGKSIIGGTAFLVSLIGIIFSGSITNAISLMFFVIIGGMILYIIVLLINDRCEAILNKIEAKNEESTSMIYFVMGYFHRKAMKLESVSVEDFDKFFIFFMYFIIPALNLGEYQSLQKYTKSIFISEISRKFLKQRLKMEKITLDKASEKYEKEKDLYSSNEFLKSLLRFGDYLLDYKNGKEVKFSTS